MLEVLFIFTKAFNENLNWVTVAKEEYLVVEESEGSNGKMPFWRGCWSQGWVQTGELTNNLSKTKPISPPSKQKISLLLKPIQTKKTPRKQTKNSSKTPQNKQKATKEIKTQRKTWNPTKAVLRSQACACRASNKRFFLTVILLCKHKGDFGTKRFSQCIFNFLPFLTLNRLYR